MRPGPGARDRSGTPPPGHPASSGSAPAEEKARTTPVRSGQPGAAALLRSSFAAQAGSARFYLLTISLAGTWTGGALGAGPIAWRGDGPGARPATAARALIVIPVLTGAATFAVFYSAALAVRRHGALRQAIAGVLRYADAGSAPLVVLIASGSAVTEELFFRGALWLGHGRSAPPHSPTRHRPPLPATRR
jgi:membrane protease YdiL (CAAX protease family)